MILGFPQSDPTLLILFLDDRLNHKVPLFFYDCGVHHCLIQG